jgi:hypothetical protein
LHPHSCNAAAVAVQVVKGTSKKAIFVRESKFFFPEYVNVKDIFALQDR